MFQKAKEHLIDSDCSYFEHLKFALYAGVALLIASLASFVHAFFPNFLQGTSARTVIKLYHQRLKNHPNTLYQEWIKNEDN